MSPQRVLILSASVGSGHKTAASALQEAFAAYDDVEVLNRDVLELTNEAYAKLYADTYQMVAKRMPWLLGWAYDINDEPLINEQPLRKLWDMLNAQPVVRFVKEFRPDICICTHFTPAGIIAQLMATDQLDTSLSVVTTDYDVQGMWLSQTFNRFFVARDESKARLIDLGLAPDRVTVSGVPVRPVLGEPVDRAAVLARYELRPDLPLLLVSAGAVGGGPAREIVAELMRMRHAVQCVVVCGSNERLLDDVSTLCLPQAERFRVLGYTTDMPDLIRAATLFVGKPGGLTASECMAAGTPMIMVAPIPGQEERNADYLLEEGAALRCNDLATIDFKLDRLLDDPERLERLRANARRIGRPDAAAVIARTALADRRAPVVFDWRARGQSARSGRVAWDTLLPWAASAGSVAVYDAERGIYLGTLTGAQWKQLRAELRELDQTTGTALLQHEQLQLLREIGGDQKLTAAIERRMAGAGTLRLRRHRLPDAPAGASAEA